MHIIGNKMAPNATGAQQFQIHEKKRDPTVAVFSQTPQV